MVKQTAALANAAQIEQLADGLSLLADALHAQLVRALRKRAADHGNGISQQEAQQVFDIEVGLRQQAMTLHLDAAIHAIAGLQVSQDSVLKLAEAARIKIAKIDKAKDLIGIGNSLLELAAAIVGGKLDKVASTFKDVKTQVQDLQQVPSILG